MAADDKQYEGVSSQNATETAGVESNELNAGATPANTPSPTGLEGYDDLDQTYQQMIDRLKKPETLEERLKRERKEKSRSLMKSVTDGLSALSSLYYTTQYAPETYDAKRSQSSAYDKVLEKAKAERDKNDEAYYNLALKIGDNKNKRAKTVRELEAEAEKQRIAKANLELKQNEDARAADLHEDKKREQTGKANKAESDAVSAGIAAEYAPQMQEAKLKTEQERANAQRASAANSYASASAHGRANVKEFSAWDEHGNEHKFKTKAAAENYAKQHGTWREVDEVTEIERDSELNGQSSQTTKKKGGYPEKPTGEDNTPPSRRKKNEDNTPPSRR